MESEEVICILEPTQVELGSGYTVSVDYDGKGRQIIDVKTYGEVDTTKIRRIIRKLFPDAQIRKLKKTMLVDVVTKTRTDRSETEE